jgi:high-affinity Fe2+/Pb2+ permease
MVREWAITYRTVWGADAANLEAEVFVGVTIVVLTVTALVSRYTFGYLRLEPVIFILISQHRGDVHTYPQWSRMLYCLLCGHLGRKE